MKIQFFTVLFISLISQLAFGSKYYWENGYEIGSKYYWENDYRVGSKYYWENHYEIGSKYFWQNNYRASIVPIHEIGKSFLFEDGELIAVLDLIP